MFTKNDLKTGMFGVTDKDDKFVVVGDHLVYMDGDWDEVSSLHDDLNFAYCKIMKVYDGCYSFKHLEGLIGGNAYTKAKLVYDRERDTKKAYNGKVVCVKRGYGESVPVSSFTIGKIYEVKNGIIISDTGYKSDEYYTVENLCGGMGWSFIPIVE